jgi:hypothetical protein
MWTVRETTPLPRSLPNPKASSRPSCYVQGSTSSTSASRPLAFCGGKGKRVVENGPQGGRPNAIISEAGRFLPAKVIRPVECGRVSHTQDL